MNALGKSVAAATMGTVALNLTTYGDMLVRGRAPSSLPSDLAGKMAEKAGLTTLDDNRKSAVGALLGYADGIGVGAAYGLLRSVVPIPWLLGGLALAAAAMVASDVPAVRFGLTDPKTWSTASWISDIVPHAVYGLTTALALESLLADA
jgi:hypothetical protein